MKTAVMKKMLVACAAAACLAAAEPGTGAPQYWPTNGWRNSPPAAQGVNGAALNAAIDAAVKKDLALHGVLVIRHGYIVMERYFAPYAADIPHELYSCTKSFVSALVGIAFEKGYLKDVTATVLPLFPGKKFARRDARKNAMRIEDLLTKTSGLAWEEGDSTYATMYTSSRDWVKFVLDRPMSDPPGARFLYSSGNSIVLSALIQETSGKDTYELAQQTLFGPLGISDPRWERDPSGRVIGGWGLRLTPRDMARLGYLYLHGGEWDGRQVVPAAWVRASTVPHIRADARMSYGYQWWIDPSVPMYAALGRFGQAIFVVPDRDLVVVFTAATGSAEPEIELIANSIVPACARE
jgi:CubicO group peptidase (beta-lactamase class C family)